MNTKEKGMLYSFQQETKWKWRTAISNVVVFDDSVEFDAYRPDSGTNTGGVAYIWDEANKLITSSKVSGTDSPGKAHLQSDLLNFEDKSYTIGYGPDQIDQGVKAVAATASIEQGYPGNYEPSTCYGYNNSATHVTSRYSVPKRIFKDGNKCQIYVVEGRELLDNSHAIDKVIGKIEGEANYKGLIKLDFENGTFKRGKAYTVCLNVYSWKRQIAGYSFIF